MVPLSEVEVVLAHGAGSGASFLQAALPADVLGAAATALLDDRSGDTALVAAAMLRAAEEATGPVILGGVSTGAHAAAIALAGAGPNVVAGLLLLPAWTGAPSAVAGMLETAADAIASLGIAGVLAELPPDDWASVEHRRSWGARGTEELVAELRTAAACQGPSVAQLRAIDVPVGIVAMSTDPLHPVSVAARWTREIPGSSWVTMSRTAPDTDIAAFGQAAAAALSEAIGER
ncbi:MAG: alpha/beta fold hydrolase [Actinobacteria bacterium]|nr:alpha/beta fold hydrolase [Actinomycetota bacterium]